MPVCCSSCASGHPTITAEAIADENEKCCSGGSCCFPGFIQSGEEIESKYGPVLGERVEQVFTVAAHSILEVSVPMNRFDAIAWTFQVVNSNCFGGRCDLGFSCYWFDKTNSQEKATHQVDDIFGVQGFWPSRIFSSGEKEPCNGMFILDQEEVDSASFILSFDNRKSTSTSKKIRLTVQHRGFGFGQHVRTSFGEGTVTGWSGRYCSYVVDVGYSRIYIPAAHKEAQELIQRPSFRFQTVFEPFKYTPSLESFGLKRIAGSFDWVENPGSTLWKDLSGEDLDVIQEAFNGFDFNRLVDYHVHVIGAGMNGSGCFITPKMADPFSSPFGYVKLRAFMSGSGISMDNSDMAYEERLLSLATSLSQNFDSSNKLVCLAFEKTYDEDGTPRMDKTTLHIPNDYAYDFVMRNRQHCLPSCSVHPYRSDCERELERASRRGVRLIKWLPNSMMIDPLSEKCDRFYRKVRELDMIILSHTGEEHSVSSAGLCNEYGNPLRLRRALDHGVKVIAAHLATEGSAIDLDQTPSSCSACPPKEENFNLLMRLFDEEKYNGLLFADFSAICCIKRAKYVSRILDNTKIHSRIVYGSDYPVPCLNFSVVTRQLRYYGLINKSQARVLKRLYRSNPLLFDLCCKKFVKSPNGNKIPDTSYYEHPELNLSDRFMQAQPLVDDKTVKVDLVE